MLPTLRPIFSKLYIPPTVFLGDKTYKATSSSGLSFDLSDIPDIQPGDVAVGSLQYKTTTNSPVVSGGDANWPSSNPIPPSGFYMASCIRRVLTAGDLDGPLTINTVQNNSILKVGVYRVHDPAIPQVKVSSYLGAGNGEIHTVPGFVKSERCAGIVGLMSDYHPDTSIGMPSGWADRGADLASTTIVTRLGDMLTPEEYEDSDDFIFTSMQGTANVGSHCFIVELLHAA